MDLLLLGKGEKLKQQENRQCLASQAELLVNWTFYRQKYEMEEKIIYITIMDGICYQ